MKDLSQIDDFLSVNEIKSLIDEFLEFYRNPTDKSLVYAFDQLCELAERQCNTYKLLEKEYQDKITEFIKKHIILILNQPVEILTAIISSLCVNQP